MPTTHQPQPLPKLILHAHEYFIGIEGLIQLGQETEADALARQYEDCVEKIISYTPTSVEDLMSKFEFATHLYTAENANSGIFTRMLERLKHDILSITSKI